MADSPVLLLFASGMFTPVKKWGGSQLLAAAVATVRNRRSSGMLTQHAIVAVTLKSRKAAPVQRSSGVCGAVQQT